ncbi:MAG: (Fe-S)-binding protein [Desulfobacterota bacterium]|jgi:Fe-S oxidoreductase|nr:(Fe-S)-binding protein [Thermodesulfobacteriota bacterium]
MESTYRDILHRCFRCGWCKFPLNYTDFNCPAYLKFRFESFSAGGRMWLIKAWLDGEIPTSDRLGQILFSCVTCRNCVESCAMPLIKDQLVDLFIAARSEMVEQGIIPPMVRDYFKAVSVSGNPYRMPREDRGKWAEGLGLERYASQEYLFYVGDEGAYDELGQKMARSVALLMVRAGISFGILGEDEITDGNDVRALGEKGLAAHLAEQNVALMNRLGVKKVVALSPHAFNAMKNEYPKHGSKLTVSHYTQILKTFAAKLAPESGSGRTVTYHDPCYLGRWNGEYSAPRAVLKAVRGLRLVEMDRAMQNALCCGGGGGNFFTDMLGSGPDLSGRVRVREALAAGADTVAVACPQCYRMLSDAVKDEGIEDSIRVRELSEIVEEALGEG